MAPVHATRAVALPRALHDPSPVPATVPGADAGATASDTGPTVAAGAPIPIEGEGGIGSLPPTWTDPQGRVFQQEITDAGHLVRRHHSTQAIPQGSLDLDITYDFSPDGTASRSIHQRLTSPTGDYRDVTELASFDAAGTQTVDDVTDVTRAGDTTTSDHTVSTLGADGKPVRRVETYAKDQRQVDPTTHERVEAHQVSVGTWDGAGAPIDDATVPKLTFAEKVTYTTPGAGINADTDRHLTTERSAAGTPGHLTWNQPMHLVARFDGHGGQYMERRIDYPLDASGAPDMAHPTIVGDEDHESTVNKVLMKTRIYGGFASSLLGMGGINLIGLGLLKGAGKGMLWAGTAVGAAAVAAEASAYVTRRNDAYWPNLAMNVYDTTWMGLYAYSRTFGAGAAKGAAEVGAAINPSRVVSDNVLAGAGVLGSGRNMVHGRGDDAAMAGATRDLVRLRRDTGVTSGVATAGSPVDGWTPQLGGATSSGPRLDTTKLPA